MVAVSPVLAAHAVELIEQRKLGFEILHDPGGATAEAYGLRWTLPADLQALYTEFGVDLPTVNGDDGWSLPIPARYLIDRTGVVRYARIDPDYTRRPEPKETLDALRRLVG